MENEIVLSVIVSLYNCEKYIEQCLESILGQNFKNLELILVNDCSTDNSLKIVQDIAEKDNRLRIINNKTNMGSGPSNNVGIAAARGKYLAFVDADDWIEQGAYAKLIDKMESSGSDICLYGMKRYFEKEKRTENYSYFDYSLLNEKLSINPDIKIWSEEVFKRFGTVGKIYKKAFLIEKNLQFKDIRLGEDVVFSVECLIKADKISICNEYLYIYRIHGESKMHAEMDLQHAKSIISFIDEVKTTLEQSGNFEKMKFAFIDFVDGQHKFYIKNKSHNQNFRNYFEKHITNFYPVIKEKNDSNVDVTIILSSYNNEKFIKKALDSALSQKYVATEIICIDDGSSDNTFKILNLYAKKYKNLLVLSHSNSGLAASRNRGLKLAKGKYIQFLDSDDYLAPLATAELFDFSSTNKLDMCSFSGVNIRHGKLMKNNYWEYKYIPTYFLNTCFKSSDIYEYMFNLPVSSCLTIYRNGFIKSINNTFPEGLCFEDNVFFLNALMQSKKYGILKKYLYCRLIHSDQITTRRDKTIFDKFPIYKKCFDIISTYYSRVFALQYSNNIIYDFIKLRKQIPEKLYDEFDYKLIDFCSYVLFQ